MKAARCEDGAFTRRARSVVDALAGVAAANGPAGGLVQDRKRK